MLPASPSLSAHLFFPFLTCTLFRVISLHVNFALMIAGLGSWHSLPVCPRIHTSYTKFRSDCWAQDLTITSPPFQNTHPANFPPFFHWALELTLTPPPANFSLDCKADTLFSSIFLACTLLLLTWLITDLRSWHFFLECTLLLLILLYLSLVSGADTHFFLLLSGGLTLF